MSLSKSSGVAVTYERRKRIIRRERCWIKERREELTLSFFGLSVLSIPLLEGGSHLVVPELQDLLHDDVNLANELHIPVLDPVVDHLDVVPGPEAAEVAGARASRALL